MSESITSTASPAYQRTARVVLATFLVTFMTARMLVFLIMSRRVPDLYVHAHGTHIHHLNYGIFLLSIVGGWLLLSPPSGRVFTAASVAYGIGLALTFDEFGMWLHLGGPYWQRASFDAVVVISAFLALIAFAPALRQFRPRHLVTLVGLFVCATLFAVLLADSFNYAARAFGPKFQAIEQAAPR